MAKYNVPYQNLSFDIPDDGETWYDEDSGFIGMRQGDTIQRFGLEDFGYNALGGDAASAAQQAKTDYGFSTSQRRAKAQELLNSQYGIDLNTIARKRYSEGLQMAVDRGGVMKYSNLTDPTGLKNYQSTLGGLASGFTQGISPDNPNGTVTTNGSGQVIQQSPSAQQALLNAGATSQQAQQISQAQIANANPNNPAMGSALNPAQLAQAGMTTPQPQAPQADAPAPATPAGATGAPVSTYTGPSVVDYLASVGQPSDFASRSLLAQKLGIQNYSGTASQNTQLLDTLRKSTPQAPTASGSAPGSTSGTGMSAPTTGTGATTDSPIKTFTEIYKEALEASGLTDIKAEFDKVQKDYDDMANELNDKIIDINSNPWLSEGLRLAEVKKLQDRYDGKMGILTNKLKIYDSLYQRAQSEARFVATGIQEDQQKMMDLAQKEQEARAKLLELNPSEFKEVRGGLYDIRNERWVVPPKEETSSSSGGILATLPLSIQNRVLSLSTGFGSSDIVKRFNAVSDSINIVNGISASSQNPADHQTIVYSFAKSLDPDSVVREGEYATIKKYAQSMVDRYGKEITNALNGTGFLSQKAINEMKTTMNNNFTNRRPQYDNLYKETSRVIDNVAGLPVSDQILVDYDGGVTDVGDGGGGGGTDPDSIPVGGTFNGADGLIYLRTGQNSFEAVGNVAR